MALLFFYVVVVLDFNYCHLDVYSLTYLAKDYRFKYRRLMNALCVYVWQANWFAHMQLRAEKLPYWDAASVLRTPMRCSISADGVHVKMFVDTVRANILFNKLCDENFQWVGGEDAFVE